MKGKKYTRVNISEWGGAKEVDIIEGPIEILDSLHLYIEPFYQYIDENYFGDLGDYDITEGFVDFLNNNVLKSKYPMVRIIERQTKNFDEKYKRYNI